MNNTDKLNEVAQLAKELGLPVTVTDTAVTVTLSEGGHATGRSTLRAMISTGSQYDKKPARVVYTTRITRTRAINRQTALDTLVEWAD